MRENIPLPVTAQRKLEIENSRNKKTLAEIKTPPASDEDWKIAYL